MSRPLRRATPVLILAALAGCNGPPEGLAIRINPEQPQTLDALEVVFDSEAVDPQGDPVTYRYTWTVDGERSEYEQGTIPSGATTYGQVWRVDVVPTDGTQVGVNATAEVTIANTPPSVVVRIEPEAPSANDDLTAIVEFTDADDQPELLTYTWVVDGSAQDERTADLRADRTAKGQVWEVIVVPNDGIDDGEEVRVSVTIGNSPPEVESAAIEPAELDRSMTARCVATGWNDPNGDTEDARIRWLVDGTEVSTDAELVLAPYERGSEVVCELTPFDGEDEGDAVTTPGVTIGNAPPSLGSVTIGPEDPASRTDVTGTPMDLVDLDGDEITLRWTWTVDGTEQGSLDRLPGNRFVRGQTIQATVVPFDGTVEGEAVSSNTLRAINTAPVLTELELDPIDPATDDDIVAIATATDVDGDSVSIGYTWYVDGTAVSGVTGDTLEGDTHFDKDQEIYVVATPRDSEAGASVTSDTALAINTPPPTPELSFDPEEPGADEDVTCEIDVQDPDVDGDTITYTFGWTKNGTAYTSATTTTHAGDTIPASARSEDDRWVCNVTPHDGDDNGVAASRGLGAEPVGFDTSGSLSSTALRGGSMAGTTYNDDCASGSFLVGISADLTSSSGGYFAELAPRCAPMTFDCGSSSCTVEHGSITTGTYRGGSGRALVNRDCPTGSVVTGFVGRAGWYMDQLTVRCAPVSVTRSGSTWSASLGSASDVSAVGGTGGSAFSRADCSSGQAATRAVIRAGTGQVDGFGLGCKALVVEVE